MYDIIDVVKNLKTLTEDNKSFRVLKDFERVIDELNIYVFENWENGELVAGPKMNRHDITCKFMWPFKHMPDPEGGKRLFEYGCRVNYERTNILLPRKIKDHNDYRPGTKKGKIDQHPIWIVEITMPKKLMQDVFIGQANKERNRIAELMKYTDQQISPENAAADTEQAPEQGAPTV